MVGQNENKEICLRFYASLFKQQPFYVPEQIFRNRKSFGGHLNTRKWSNDGPDNKSLSKLFNK